MTARRAWAPNLAGLLGATLAIAGAAWVTWLLLTKDASVADPVSSALGFVLAASGAAISIVSRALRRRQLVSLPPLAEQVDQAATTLAGVVYQQWTTEAHTRSLLDPHPMPVRWRLSAQDAMDHYEVITSAGKPDFSGSSKDAALLAAKFLALSRRRLVITGGPGTGKTSLAVLLLLQLLPKAGRAPSEAVPVFLTAQSWDPAARPNINAWLATQLDLLYPQLRGIHPTVSVALVEQGRVLPVLDGFDEVSTARRTAMIAALNTSLASSGIIITSRTTEFRSAIETAKQPLVAAAVAAPYSLAPADAEAYLRLVLPPKPSSAWRTLLAALSHPTPGTPGAAVARAVATPLGLWLIRRVYADRSVDPPPLTDSVYNSESSMREHLLDGLILASVNGSAEPAAARHRADALQRCLTGLAKQLAITDSRDWTWWTLHQIVYPSRLSRAPLAITVGAITSGLAAVPLICASWARPDWPELLTVAVGLAALVAANIIGGAWGTPHTTNFSLCGRYRELSRDLTAGAIAGAVLATLLLGLSSIFDFFPLNGVQFLLLAALHGAPAGLAAGILRFVNRPSSLVSFTPSQTYKSDGRSAVVVGSIVGIAICASIVVEDFTIPAMPIALGVVIGALAAAAKDFSARIVVSGLALLYSIPALLTIYWNSAVGPLSVASYDPVAADLPAWKLVALTMGLYFGGLYGVVLGVLSTAWAGFVLAGLQVRARLGFPTPWTVMKTLEDCYRLGLLRKVGPVYQFRHAELQDHLTSVAAP